MGLVESAALERGAHGITVDVVVPGLIHTPLTRHRQRYLRAVDDLNATAATDAVDVEAVERLTARSPLGGPWIEPEDVAPVVVLASDEAKMVSGGTYAVTAGDSADLPD